MTSIEAPQDFSRLKEKTILLTGCATGIGRATAELAYSKGANLILADWNEKDAKYLVSQLGGDDSRILLRKVDVSSWDDVLSIWEEGITKFGIIHAVISNAGIAGSMEDLLGDEIDETTGKLKKPSMKSIDVNLIAHTYMVKCAMHFFRKWPEVPCQIILTGSAASYIDTPPIYLYCAAKAGVLGLMRALRSQLCNTKITVNMIAPWMTITAILPSALRSWWGELPANTPEGVATALLIPALDESVNGKTFWVWGNKITELEDKIHETQPVWMGPELSAAVDDGQRLLLAGGITQ